MKTNKASRGGFLLTEYFDAYALYFVCYIEEMKKEGFTIDAITIQNEPLYGGNLIHYVSCHQLIKLDLLNKV